MWDVLHRGTKFKIYLGGGYRQAGAVCGLLAGLGRMERLGTGEGQWEGGEEEEELRRFRARRDDN